MVSFSFFSRVLSGDHNSVNIYKNGEPVEGTNHFTAYTDSNGELTSTGGRTLYMHVSKSDILHLGTERIDQDISEITTCFQLINV